MYAWKKTANQSKLDKDHKLRDLRNDKMFSLKVKGFSSLLFHRNEMKHVRQQKRRYRFFRTNRVFRAWSLYVIKKQEHDIKVNFLRKRWDLIKTNRIVDSWGSLTLKWRQLYHNYDAVLRMDEEFQAKHHFSAWKDLFRQQHSMKKALKFRFFKLLQGNTRHQQRASEIVERRVNALITKRNARLIQRVFGSLERYRAVSSRGRQLKYKCDQKLTFQVFSSMRNQATKSTISHLQSQLDDLIQQLSENGIRLKDMSALK
jgi:hypothetical protein